MDVSCFVYTVATRLFLLIHSEHEGKKLWKATLVHLNRGSTATNCYPTIIIQTERASPLTGCALGEKITRQEKAPQRRKKDEEGKKSSLETSIRIGGPVRAHAGHPVRRARARGPGII